MDTLGHVNNTVYFRYMEQARIEWLYAMRERRAYDATQGPVIVTANCHFKQPLTYPGDITVAVYLEHPGRTSVGNFYEIDMNGQRYADGAAKIVWIDFQTGRPVPLPGFVAAALLDADDMR